MSKQTYSSEAVMPFVNNMSVILIVKLVGKVCAASGCTEHRHETWVVAALLHINQYSTSTTAVHCHISTPYYGLFNLR